MTDLSPDIVSDWTGITANPPIDITHTEHRVVLAPTVINLREIIVRLCDAMSDKMVRADLLLVRQLPISHPDHAQALDRLADDTQVRYALSWAISQADADDLAQRLDEHVRQINE